MKTVFAGLFLLIGIAAQAQLSTPAPAAVKGHFYVWVDDEADLIINGKKLMHVTYGHLDESPEIELKAGDHLVVQLLNKVDKRAFMTLFLSTDKAQEVPFPANTFKVLKSKDVTDFTPEEFHVANKYAKKVVKDFEKLYYMPVKSTSEWMWGDLDMCAIGCIINQEMFKQNPHR